MVDYDGKEYLVFEVASLKEPDQYGKTHTAYISKKVAEPKGGSLKRPMLRKSPQGLFFVYLSMYMDMWEHITIKGL